MATEDSFSGGGLGSSSLRPLATEFAEQQLTALLNVSPFSVRMVDLEGCIVRENDVAVSEFTGNAPRNLRELWERQPLRELEYSGSGEGVVAFESTPAMQALAGEVVRAQRFEFRQGGGSRILEVSSAPVLSADGACVGAVLIQRDITDQYPARELLMSHELDARKRRLAAVGQLAAGVMHDVNNALNPIMAAAYLLEHHAESPAAVREYAERIRQAAEMGAATASRVGRFIRQEPLPPGADSEFDLSLVVQEVLELTSARLLKQADATNAARNEVTKEVHNEVRIESELETGLRCRGIAAEIREALLSIIQNSLDAMSAGANASASAGTGAITGASIGASSGASSGADAAGSGSGSGGGTGSVLRVKCWREGDSVCVSVLDTGVGMSPDVSDRVFEPFFGTKGSQGSGLGLAEVYGIVQRHRGDVSIESELGAGTKVSICLPGLKPKVAEPESAKEKKGPVRALRILVVEDHDDGRLLLRRILERDGHSVDAVSTVAEARECLLKASPKPYELLLTDAGLPDGSGWGLAEFAHTTVPGLRVGLITGWEPSAESEMTPGVEFVLRKPLRAQELKAHIEGRISIS